MCIAVYRHGLHEILASLCAADYRMCRFRTYTQHTVSLRRT